MKKLEELFECWERKHKIEEDVTYIGNNIPKSSFLPDGIIDFSQYNSKKVKILFVGKEAYRFYEKGMLEENEKYTLKKFWLKEVANGNLKETMFSKRLAMLSNAINDDDYKTINKDHKILQSVAFLNLNKRGGFNHCKWKNLEEYVIRYKDDISKEINLISPTLIICCGKDVNWLLKKYIEIESSIKILTVSHPSYYKLTDSQYLRQLESAVKGYE